MLLPALGRRSWAGEFGRSQPIPTPFLSASLTLIKLLTSRVAPPLLWKVLCSQHVRHMCLQYPRFTMYIIIGLRLYYASSTHIPAALGPARARYRPLETQHLFAGRGWGWASDLYLIYFIGFFRARRLPLSVSACSTFIGLGGKNKGVCIYIFLVWGVCGEGHRGRKTCLSRTVLQGDKPSKQLAWLCLC